MARLYTVFFAGCIALACSPRGTGSKKSGSGGDAGSADTGTGTRVDVDLPDECTDGNCTQDSYFASGDSNFPVDLLL